MHYEQIQAEENHRLMQQLDDGTPRTPGQLQQLFVDTIFAIQVRADDKTDKPNL